MPEISKEEMIKLLDKYKGQIDTELAAEPEEEEKIRKITSHEYKEFKKEYMPRHMSIYEKACNKVEEIAKIKPAPKIEAKLQNSIDICHLNMTPTGAYSFSLIAPIALLLLGGAISFLILNSLFFVLIFLIVSFALIPIFGGIPHFMANSWRMKASNQMVLCIFYVVTYMRHTSNLELGIEFAADHLAPPLSLDLRRVLWNVETEKYESVKESLDIYLETWKDYNMEFVESFHLIESSLYEGSEDRRISLLDKSLDVILSETYEKMLHYAHNLKSPITMLHMLGVILPVMGLVILPLIVSFMQEVKWYHIATLYDIILPAAVYYLGIKILSTRPTGYGDTDISSNPEIKKFKNIIINLLGFEIKINPAWFALTIGVICVIIGLSPILLHIASASAANPLGFDLPLMEGRFQLIGYRESIKTEGLVIGPFGIGASVVSFFLPLGLGLGVGLFYKLRSQNIIKIRKKSKQLEQEFAAALFQLGNRLGDGLPAEIAFGKVAETMKDSISGRFFKLVASNITRGGMSVNQAIFDPEHGAILQYPSNLIESSMKVLAVSAKKGPLVAAQALINVSRYIKEMHKVNERLKDLMADTIASMKSQINFLTPAISGIVIGITSMVTTIIGKLGVQMQQIQARTGMEGAGAAGAGGLTQLFGDGMPTFFFQIIVGFYVVLLIYILTVIVNGIENGSDKLNERFLIGLNMVKSTTMYCIIGLIVMILFNMIAGNIMGKALT